MVDDPDRDRLNALAAKIRKAEAADGDSAHVESDQTAEERNESVKASRVGFDFVAAVGICAAIGWFADREIGTKPFGIMIMVCVGFVVGFVNVWRALNGYEQSIGWKKKG